jgi:hypothetical protein
LRGSIVRPMKMQLNECIYCSSDSGLSDEHAIPFGLGGSILLKKASCEACRVETGRLEQRLLRGHWRPYRHYLNLKSRSRDFPKTYPVTVHFRSGVTSPAELPAEQYPAVLFFEFDPPAIFSGQYDESIPAAPRVYLKQIRKPVEWVLIDGAKRFLQHPDRIEFPTSFSCADLCRVLAKISHCLAIHKLGSDCCEEFFLPKLILGDGAGSLTYVGGCSTNLVKPRLPGTVVHGFLVRQIENFIVVNLQLFREFGDLPPIYEVIVGRAKL